MTLRSPFPPSAITPPRERSLVVRYLVKIYPILRSNSIRADTASTWRSSSCMGCLAAWRTWLDIQHGPNNLLLITYALSTLLNLALLTSRFLFPLKASARTSPPICSPSRSQSVQMNKARACLASSRMLSDIAVLSLKRGSQQAPIRLERLSYLAHFDPNSSSEKHIGGRMAPIAIFYAVLKGSLC